MTTAIFIVIYARSKWWIDLNGKSKGPYLSRESAELEAIQLASTFAKDGRRAEVQVAEPGRKNHIVWQSGACSGVLRRWSTTKPTRPTSPTCRASTP